jgi:hypothetical protein
MDSRPDDETLLLAVAERDMGAFRVLYERHAGWLAVRLARRCNDRDPPAGEPAAARGGVAVVSGRAGVVPAAEDQVLLSVEYGDVGQALAVSSVKTRLYRARARLRAALAEGPS